jgi:hypothetical protein
VLSTITKSVEIQRAFTLVKIIIVKNSVPTLKKIHVPTTKIVCDCGLGK